MSKVNNFIEFEYNYPAELPCGGMYVASYRVKAAYYPVFEWNDAASDMEFKGMRFELPEVWRTDQGSPYLVPSCGTHPSMVSFANTLKAEAERIYNKRSGSTDFAEVVVHDSVGGVAVKVVETIQLTSKAA